MLVLLNAEMIPFALFSNAIGLDMFLLLLPLLVFSAAMSASSLLFP